MSDPKPNPKPTPTASVASDRVSDQAYAIVQRFTTAKADGGSGWNNAPSPLLVQALLDANIPEARIVEEFTHFVDDINGGDSYLAFEGNKDRGQAVVFKLLKGIPYDVTGVQIAPYGAAERIVHGLLGDFAEDRIARALRKLVQSEPV